MVQCPLLKRVSLVALETLAVAELIVSQHVDDRAQVHGKKRCRVFLLCQVYCLTRYTISSEPVCAILPFFLAQDKMLSL